MTKLRIFLIEPFFSGSHQAWAQGYKKYSNHTVHLITQPGTSWRKRMRTSATPLAEEIKKATEKIGKSDLLLISSMTNAAELLHLINNDDTETPTALYVHENQLTYPRSPKQKLAADLVLITWKSMLTVDNIFFNSTYHRETFLDALPAFLSVHAPDELPYLENMKQKCCTMHVGVDLENISLRKKLTPEVPQILWNQRWEYDKNPELVLQTLQQTAEQGYDFNIVLTGECPRLSPTLKKYLSLLADRITHTGYCSREKYLTLLHQSDIVISAARHEFFGISVVEATAAGAIPVLPNDLSYPEILTPGFSHFLYAKGEFQQKLLHTLRNFENVRSERKKLAEHMQHYSWETTAPRYDAVFSKKLVTHNTP